MEFIKKLFSSKAVPSGPNLADEPGLIEALCNNQLDQVAAAIAAREVRYGTTRAPGHDWSKGVPDYLYKQADYLIKRQYLDLPGFTGTQQKRVGSALALCVLFGRQKTEVPERLRAVMGGHFFECVELSEFCMKNPCGTYVVKIDQQVLYWTTRLSEAQNVVTLQELKAAHKGDGIQINTIANDPCRICKTGKTVFLWRDLDELPELPRHWGCRCSYEAFIRK